MKLFRLFAFALAGAILVTTVATNVPVSADPGLIPPGFPDETTTGPSDRSLLTYHKGTLTIREDNTVVENLELDGRLEIWGAKNVVVRNVWVYTRSAYSIRVFDGASATIEDVEIGHPDYLSPYGSRGIAGENITARRVNIHHVEDGIKVADDSHYEEIYCHDLASATSDPHSDCVQDDGGGENWSVRNSTLDAGSGNSAVIIKTDLGPISNVVVDGNYLDGGNYTTYVREGGNGDPVAVALTNNAFGRNGVYGINSRDADITWEGNYWADTPGEYIDDHGVPTGGGPTTTTTTSSTTTTTTLPPTTTTTVPPTTTTTVPPTTTTTTTLPPGTQEVELWVSRSPDRSDPTPLEGGNLSGDVYVFVDPDEGIDDVSFSVDGNYARTERSAPYDLGGGSADQASPFDVAALAAGSHTVRADVTWDSGSQTSVERSFTTGTVPTTTTTTTTTTTLPPTTTTTTLPPTTTTTTLPPTTTTTTTTTTTLPPTTTTVPSPDVGFEVWVSDSPQRTTPQPLDGAKLEGDAYVFVTPTEGVDRVTFFVDGSPDPVKTERTAPFDLGGTESVSRDALPFDMDTLAPGSHTLTVVVDEASGAQTIIDRTFATYRLMVSDTPDRSNAVPLEATTASGNVYVFVEPSVGLDEVRFFVDDPSGLPQQIERNAPFDLAGTMNVESGGTRLARPYATDLLADGSHTVFAELVVGGATEAELSARFDVTNP